MSLLEAFVLTLLHTLWQGTLFAALCALGLRLLDAPRERCALALAGLLAVPVCTVLTFAGLVGGGSLPVVVEGAWLEPSSWGGAIRLGLLAPWLAGAWLVGAAGNLLWLALGYQRLRALLRASRPAPEPWRRALAALAGQFGISAELRVSGALRVPMTVGWLRPVVLLPTAVFGGLSVAQLEAVLLHELAHIRRRDYLVNALQVVLEALLFYHPAVWWLSGAVRRERERCCDELAARRFGDALGYAAALASLEALRHPSPLVLSAAGGSLMQRIHRLLDVRPAPRRPAVAALAVLSLVLLAACAARLPSASAAPSALCLSAQVQTGAHAIPAFNEAAERVMQRALAEQGVASACGPEALRVAYHMRFSARTLSWQADLQASDARGGVLWRGERRAAFNPSGAFQYTTEANAEDLLREFLATR